MVDLPLWGFWQVEGGGSQSSSQQRRSFDLPCVSPFQKKGVVAALVLL